ncbi:hypothetical protein GCM10011579_008770 [Streptomyces albiflavescens]|uniref:Uncharacterized protein n=1 Tax=Streptomyces albiflavescens TaxID=1623582 RepID=A0A917XUF6_9ACTN|nr:hypothetical protein GCM10011579_008770 [Streptomyces albiflavescens]
MIPNDGRQRHGRQEGAELSGHHPRVADARAQDVLLDERREAMVAFVDDAGAAYAGVDCPAHIVGGAAETRAVA